MRTLLRRSLVSLSLLGALMLLAGGCAEGLEDDTPAAAQATVGFEIQPAVTVSASERASVRLNHIMLGVGTLIFEPIDDLNAQATSTREPLALVFDLSRSGVASLELPPVLLDTPGLYRVSIAIEPLPDGATQVIGKDDARAATETGDHSVLLDGLLMRNVEPEPGSQGPVTKPEPVPWLTRDKGIHTELIPFEFRSERTGFVRLGEVKLSPNNASLEIYIDLDAWMNQAVDPIIASLPSGHSASPSPGDPSSAPAGEPTPANPGLDLEHYLDADTAGIERLFDTVRAEVR